MKPTTFKQSNVTYGEGQPQYLPLPAYKSETSEGEVISCWSLSFWERLQVLFTGRIWVCLITFHSPLQPSRVTVKSPFSNPKPLYRRLIDGWIWRTKKSASFWVWRNLSGEPVPFYENPALEMFKTASPPQADAWRGWKLKLWNKAKDYLVSIGELTYTPALREPF